MDADELEEVRDVFDLFDFWDGRDGMIDAVKVGDLLRCIGLNPTIAQSIKVGATKKMGEKQYKFEEFLAIYKEISETLEQGTFADYNEAFKTFDREGQGLIPSAEMRHVLTSLGERLTDNEVDSIIQWTETHEDIDGNVKFADFIKKVMAGPFPDKK
ncbi:myosin catalytic light chain LC-1, mantle muscle-like [Tubulanus polymorphus]|uniref:myosin catalytic light chain LC-1, mantle muscle-like n=1 Tax=Tubulanus polymorphus TaxID=672921 RepID=UPI003DA56D30